MELLRKILLLSIAVRDCLGILAHFAVLAFMGGTICTPAGHGNFAVKQELIFG